MGSLGGIVSRRSLWLVLFGLFAVGAVLALTGTGIHAEVGLTTTAVEATAPGVDASPELTGLAGGDKALTGLSLSPEGIYFDGPKGGPFRQSHGSFKITNTSLVTVNWSVDEDVASMWAVISSAASGALAPGESIEVVVQLDAGAAAAFAGGSYAANLSVYNNDTGGTTTMPVNLFVADPLYSTTHPNTDLWFANTTFDVSWSGTFYPTSNRFLWKVNDQADSVITDTDPDIHTASGVRQAEITGNLHGTHYFHLVAIDLATTGIIAASLRHYQFNVIAEPPTVVSSSHPNGLSMERDFRATPAEHGPGEVAPTWTQVTPSGSIWSARREHGVAVFNGRLWVLGGTDSGGNRNDVWSSVDGKTWVIESGGTGWSARGRHGAAVLNSRLWVLGGSDSTGDRNDVWSSGDGKVWVEETRGAAWAARDMHGVAAFNSRLWVLGGDPAAGFLNDVWSSVDGNTWVREMNSAGWSQRNRPGVAVFNNRLWVLGGYNYYSGPYWNDVWSTADGRTWGRETGSAGWSVRTGHRVAVFRGKLWVVGGSRADTYYNDVWSSADGGTWARETGSAEWSARDGHEVAVFKNRLWVLGGYDGHLRNDVWFLGGPALSGTSFSQWLYLIDLSPDTVVTENNGVPWADDLPTVVPAQKPGEHWFHVAAQDTLGNLTPTGHYHFTVGDAVPVVSSSSHASPSTKKDAVLSWTDGGLPSGLLDRWYYAFNQSPTTAVTTGSDWTKDPGKTFTCQRPGDWYLHIATYDTYQNLSSQADYHVQVLQSAAPVPDTNPHRDPTKSYGCRDLAFAWTDPETVDPAVNGYRYVFDQQPGTDPGNPESGDTTSGRQFAVQNAMLGTHYFHVVGEDACGFYSAPGHFRVNIRRAHAPVVRLELNSTAQLLHFTWTDPENPPFATCYLVVCDRNPRTTPTAELCQTFYNQFDVTESPTPWYLHVIAEDAHKNQSDPVHYAVMVGGGMSLAISNPSKEYTRGGEDIIYDVIYASATSIRLQASDITVHAGGTATAASPTIVANGNIRTLTFHGASISGNGPVYFSLPAGTATGPSGPAPAMDSPPFVVDNIKPALDITAPSLPCATSGPVQWTVTYSDEGGLDWASLGMNDVTLALTGSVAVGALNVEAVNATTFTVTVDDIQGKGTVGFSVAANTAADFAGNTADGKPSLTCNVDTTPPVASSQTVSLHMNTSKNVDISATDPDDPTLTYVWSQPTNGTLSGTPPMLTYSPPQYFVGTVYFTFTASDGCYTTSPATVTLNVTNTPPVAQDQSVSLHMNTPKAITVVATDADGNSLTYVPLTSPLHGTLAGTLPNVTYTPDNCYVGVDQFQFRASDGQPNSNTATVAITVTNTAPLAQDQSVSLHMNTPKAITVVATDDGDPLTYALVSGPAHGALSGTLPNVTYTPSGCYVGQDQFTFKANDCAADSNTATVAITVTNSPPVAADQTASLHMNTPKAIALAATDPDNDSLTYAVVSGPAHGTLSGTLPNLTYTPSSCYVGQDQFTFKANDCAADSNTATVVITVANTAPVAADQTVSLHMNTPKVIMAVATDADGDPLTYVVASGPTHGTLSGTLPDVTYTPAACYAGPDVISFTASDCQAVSNVAIITIDVTNTAPVAQDQTVQAHTNQAQAIALTGADVDSDPLSFAVASSPEHGSLDGTPPNLTYTPGADYAGNDSFTFTASDCQATSTVATVSLDVAALGSLLVTLEPEYARTTTPNAQWRVDGGDWHVSGDTVNDLAVGDHVVSFSDIPAQDTGGCTGSKVTYTTPAEQHVTITANQTATTTGVYEKASKDFAAGMPSGGKGGDLLLFGVAAAALGGIGVRKRIRILS